MSISYIYQKCPMEDLKLKHELVNACLKLKQESELNLMQAIQEAELSANEYGQPKDRYDSYREQLSARREMLTRQLQKVQEELGLLDRIDLSRPCEVAGFGAVVITPVQKVFIAVGMGKVAAAEEEFFVISPVVPFAQAIKGLRRGDTFAFNGKKLNITDLY